jgi:ankyrin repeat protein
MLEAASPVLRDYFAREEESVNFWKRLFDRGRQSKDGPIQKSSSNLVVATAEKRGPPAPKEQTSLQHTADNGEIATAQSFLAEGVDVNTVAENGETPLHRAAKQGNHLAVEFLLARGASIGAKDKDGKTPLHHTVIGNPRTWVQTDNTVIVQALLDKGADVNAVDQDGWSPLHYAASGGVSEIAQLLVDNGADINTEVSKPHSGGGLTPLLMAINSGNAKVAELIAAKKPEVWEQCDNLYFATDAHITALHFAAEKGLMALAELLLTQGADVNATDDIGRTPLHFATGNDHIDMVKLLLNQGADIHARCCGYGNSVLHAASAGGSKEVCELLVAKGADINAVNHNAWTMWHFAASKGNMPVAELLLTLGLNINARIAAKRASFADAEEGFTPLHLAAKECHLGLAKLLLANGADVDAPSWISGTALHVAVNHGHLVIAESLLANGADVNRIDSGNHQRTPLIIAADRGDPALVTLLLAKGANATAKGIESFGHTKGRTALHFVAEEVHNGTEESRAEVVRLLLANGAVVEEKDEHGNTPLHLAASMGNTVIAELLLARGANVNAKTNHGETPLSCAMSRIQRSEVEEVLKRYGAVTGNQES